MQHVTNNATGPRTFQAKDEAGNIYTAVIIPGATETLELVDPKHPVVVGMVESGEIVLKPVGKAKPDGDGGGEQGPKAVHRGAGSYSVMEGESELVEKLTKEEAEAFNALDAAGKAAFVADRKKAD